MIDFKTLQPGETHLIEAPAGEGWKVLNTLHEDLGRAGLSGAFSMTLLVAVDTLTRRVTDVVRVARVAV